MHRRSFLGALVALLPGIGMGQALPSFQNSFQKMSFPVFDHDPASLSMVYLDFGSSQAPSRRWSR